MVCFVGLGLDLCPPNAQQTVWSARETLLLFQDLHLDSLTGLEARLWFYYKTQCLKNEQTFGSSEMNSFNIFHKLMDGASADFPDLTFRITRSHQTNLGSKQSDGQNVFCDNFVLRSYKKIKTCGHDCGTSP